jgi:NAD(P)H-flavin reductase
VNASQAASAVTPSAVQSSGIDPLLPVRHRVVWHHPETHDSVSLRLEPVGVALPRFLPGQFMMLDAQE